MATTNQLVDKVNSQVASINRSTGGAMPQLTPLTPITPSSLSENVQPADVTPAVDATAPTQFQEQVSQPQGDFAQQQQQKTEQAGTMATQSFEDYVNAVIETPGQAQLESEQYQKFNVDNLQAKVKQYDLQIAQEQQRLRRQIERVQQEGGGLQMGAQAEIRNLERESIAYQADLGMVRAFAQNDYLAAKQTADRAVDAVSEQNQRYISALKENYQRNQDLFTTSQQREFQVKLADYERKQNFEIKQFEALQSTKLDALRMAQTNNAPQSVIEAIGTADTPEEVYALGGQWASVDMLDRMYKNAQIANIYDTINARAEKAREEAQKASEAEDKQKEQLKADTEQALGIKTLANELLTHPGLDSAVGWGFRKSVIGSLPFNEGAAYAGSSRADFEAAATRLANMLTVDNLDLMRGVLSETDIKILASVGSNLANFDMSEASYIKEVQRVIEVADRTISENGLTEEQASFWGIVGPDDIDEINSIYE